MSLVPKESDFPPSLFSVVPGPKALPVVLHIPHSAVFIPQRWQSDFIVSDEELVREHMRIVDWFTDELFLVLQPFMAAALVSNLSRLVCDPERFEEDSKEVMATRGVGVLYERSTLGELIRPRLTAQRREEILSQFYRPYHEKFTQLVHEVLDAHGTCLILDCHSYPEHALPYELSPTGPRPDVCLGTDPQHSPDWLIQVVRTTAMASGFSVALDSPFSGTIVPLSLYGDPRVSSLMLEVNRCCYMNELNTTRHRGVDDVVGWLRKLGAQLCLAMKGADPDACQVSSGTSARLGVIRPKQ